MLKKVWNILGLILLVLFFFTACGREEFLLNQTSDNCIDAAWDEVGEMQLQETTGETDKITEREEPPVADSQSMQELIYVHVCGAVITPGVYQIPKDSRIFDAIDAAGGLEPLANTEAINLVADVSDGEQIRIPFIGEEKVDSGLININNADVSLLCEIPGIGETRAQAIVDYREANGGFQTVEELMEVNGIKEGLFAKIAPFVECKP